MSNLQSGIVVGRVAGLWRYPVKSMAAEELAEVGVSWHGLAGDRRWALIRNDVAHSGFPWLTIRERNDMSHYRPFFLEPDRPDKSPLVVRTPSGTDFGIADAALAAELYPSGAQVIKQNQGIFDTFPLSLITTRTITDLGARLGTSLDVQRFRPNILIEPTEDGEFPEDAWVGRTLRIGSLRLRVDKRDGRCVVITVDPVTTERNTEILRTVARDRQGCLGVYGSTVDPGRIALKDSVWIEPDR
jgi:uncharacterized protein